MCSLFWSVWLTDLCWKDQNMYTIYPPLIWMWSLFTLSFCSAISFSRNRQQASAPLTYCLFGNSLTSFIGASSLFSVSPVLLFAVPLYKDNCFIWSLVNVFQMIFDCHEQMTIFDVNVAIIFVQQILVVQNDISICMLSFSVCKNELPPSSSVRRR